MIHANPSVSLSTGTSRPNRDEFCRRCVWKFVRLKKLSIHDKPSLPENWETASDPSLRSNVLPPPHKKIVHILPYALRQRVKYGLEHFLDHYFWGGGKGWPLALRGRWGAVYQHSGRDGRQTVVTEGGVEDELQYAGRGGRFMYE